MSLNDPISDTLTRLRNAQAAGHDTVDLIWSNIIESILKILKSEGYISGFLSFKDGKVKRLKADLKYYNNKPVIRRLDRVSKPGRRIYQQWRDIRPERNSIGISIMSTPKGVMTGKDAKFNHVGGEIICKVW